MLEIAVHRKYHSAPHKNGVHWLKAALKQSSISNRVCGRIRAVLDTRCGLLTLSPEVPPAGLSCLFLPKTNPQYLEAVAARSKHHCASTLQGSLEDGCSTCPASNCSLKTGILASAGRTPSKETQGRNPNPVTIEEDRKCCNFVTRGCLCEKQAAARANCYRQDELSATCVIQKKNVGPHAGFPRQTEKQRK